MAASEGLEFPLDNEGKRSTTQVNQGAFAAALANVDPDASEKVKAEKKWRFGYAKHVVTQVDIAASSPEKAINIAKDGLEYMHNQFPFLRDGSEIPIKEAMQKYNKPVFETATVKGTQGPNISDYEVPYQGKVLKGEELQAQIELWVQRGVIELDTGAALCQVANTAKWRDLRDVTVVLFGAGSAMGPFPILMSLGANVIALDLDRKPIWDRLIKTAKASPGTLTFPVKKKGLTGDDELAENAGCNLLTQTPEIRTWLAGLMPDKQLVLGAYAYLDGPLFVRVSMAMDAIIAELIRERKVKPALAYLCTPTDCHVCTSTSKAAAMKNFRQQPIWQGLVAKVLGLTMPKMAMSRNAARTNSKLPIVDAIVKEQGPNYCLAKRLQHWRSIVARSQGCIVSTNIAPSTSTASVVSNKSFAMAYKGMHHFKPMEVSAPETSNAVMAALLINDLRNPFSAGHPDTPLENPMQLFSATSFHGGAWRTGYKFGTIGPPSVIAYLFLTYAVGGWLTLYNFGQCAGWSIAAANFIMYLTGSSSATSLWAAGGWWVSKFTYFQAAEVCHSALGMVRSPALTTAMQIASRITLVQILDCKDVSANPDSKLWPTMLCGAWCLTEIVRYAYFGLAQLKIKIYPVTWLRYSMFPILYPTGVAGELGCVYYAMPFLAAGKCGLCADFVAKCGFPAVLGIYAVCFPMLFMTVVAQRKKVLGGDAKPKDKKA